MAQPLTHSETGFAEYLIVHGYQSERDVDWRSRFGVDTFKNPDFLVSRAGEDLAICEVKEFEDTPLDRRLGRPRKQQEGLVSAPPASAWRRYSSGPGAELYSPAGDAVRDAAREQLRPFADVGLP